MDIVGVMLFCFVYTVSATTYYVANDGNDTNPGSEVLPFRTIQKAADTARSGDTVLVEGGHNIERP